jgi:hypothetical protein
MRGVIKWTVAALLALALLQAALWYAASRWFAEAARMLAPVAELTYDSSFAWPNGRAGIRGVRLVPVLVAGEELAADSVSFRTGGPVALLRLLLAGADEPPQSVSLRIERFRLSANAERQLREQASRLGYLAPFEALGCNDTGRFSGTDYAELGWLQSGADIEVDLNQDPPRGGLELVVGYDMNPLGRLDVELDLEGVPMAGGPATASADSVQLRRALLRYTDRGMLAARNAYCAGKLNAAPDAFVNHHVEAVRAEIEARGTFPDDPLVELYRGFAARGGQLELTAAPSSTIALSQFGHYSPDDRLRLFNAGISHDGGPRVPVSARFFGAGTGTGTSSPKATESVAVRAQASDADSLLFDELPGLTGRRIAIDTRQGVDYVGTLLGIQGPLVRLQVEQRVGRSQTVAVSRDSIESMRLVD